MEYLGVRENFCTVQPYFIYTVTYECYVFVQRHAAKGSWWILLVNSFDTPGFMGRGQLFKVRVSFREWRMLSTCT